MEFRHSDIVRMVMVRNHVITHMIITSSLFQSTMQNHIARLSTSTPTVLQMRCAGDIGYMNCNMMYAKY